MRYKIPEDLIHAGQWKDLKHCPYDFYSSEIVIPDIVSYRLEQPDDVEIFLDPDAANYDYYIVPHYSSCHYHQCINRPDANRDECRKETAKYMEDILDYIEKAYPFWDRNHGMDHIFVFTWDEASTIFPSNFLRNRLASSIHLTHLGTPTAGKTFDPRKDVCIPPLRVYNEVEAYPNRYDAELHQQRTIFAYFRGTFKGNNWSYGRGIRHAIEIYGRDDPHNYFVKDKHSQFYWNELLRTRFALCPPGWSSWSPRLFDAIVAGAIPVIISDDWVPPFSELINYDDFSIRVPESKIDKLTEILKAIPAEEEARLRGNLKKVYERFVYSMDYYGDKDAFESIYEILVRKKQQKESNIKAILGGFAEEDADEDNSDVYPRHSPASDDEESVNDITWARIEL